MPDPTDVEVVEAGLAASWSRQVGWTGGSCHRVGGLLVAISGVDDQTQQVAVVDGAVVDPEAAVVAAEVLFDRAGWQPAVDLVAGAHPGLEEALSSRGFRVVAERPGMVLRAHDPVPAVDPQVEVRPATPSDRAAIVGVQAEAFGLPRRIAGSMLPPPAFVDAGVSLLVALDRRRRIVGSVGVHVDGAVAGIVGAGVLPRARRRGAGTALTLAALATAVDRGAEAVWLQATPAGLPVYRRCGFRPVAACQVWLRSHPE